MTVRKILSLFMAVAFFFAVFTAGATRAEAQIDSSQVERAWKEVCEALKMKELPLTIKDDKVPNAWVTAGQSVTVTTGLMSLLDSEDEIFGVLCHEAGHVALKHYEGRMTNAASVGIAAALLKSLLGNNAIGGVAVDAGANLASAGYSREQEVAADDYAVDTAFKAHRDPVAFYHALQRLSYYGKTQPSGFNSHPPDARRLQHVKDRILKRDPSLVIKDIPKPTGA